MTKKAGTEGGPDNPESFRDRDWRPKKIRKKISADLLFT